MEQLRLKLALSCLGTIFVLLVNFLFSYWVLVPLLSGQSGPCNCKCERNIADTTFLGMDNYNVSNGD